MQRPLVDLPEIEYLDGVAHPKVSPRRTHSLVQGALICIVHACMERRGSLGPEWDCRPGGVDGTDTKFVPDIAFFSHERLRALAPEDREEPPFSPDIAIEVRSPSNDARYIADKCKRYLETGAILVLDVDPATRTIAAHSNDGVVTFGAGERFEHPAAPWLNFDVYAAFADLDEE